MTDGLESYPLSELNVQRENNYKKGFTFIS